MRKITVGFTGGGTGGHVYPGLAVIQSLKEKSPDIRIMWIGSGRGMEKKIIDRSGLPFYSVPAGKLRRYFSLENAADVFRIIAGFISSVFLLKRLGIDILFSKGGFVSVPPVAAARILGIPVITHDSDLEPGLATRINSRFADTVLLPYMESVSFFKKRRKIIVTGNPVRKEILEGDPVKGRSLFGIPEDKKIILVLGGSLGALQINTLFHDMIDRLIPEYFVVHQMGEYSYRESDIEGYVSVPFLNEELPHILAAADLVVSRAGAGTLWESGVRGKASVLIPLGTGSSRGDQLKNAEYFEKRGAAYVLKGDVKGDDLYNVITSLMHDDVRREAMGKAASEICNGDSADRIADIILQKVS